ncbi:MAG: PspC domain-containing protein [Bacteroidales bacterium]
MKKVVKVSIGKLAFTIDDDGYELLKAYLGELNAHYKSKQNGDEIIEGIEERMAELFIEKSGKGSVVSMQVVKDVINILGRPEIIDEETRASGFESNQERGTRAIPKRVYRDPDNKMLGGVCSGLATYFNIDKVLVRILFLIFFIGFSILGFHLGGGSFMVIAYIILWIVIPEAKTVEQKCAMHGESADLSHIQKRVEDGLTNVGSGLKKAGSQGGMLIVDILKKVIGVLLVFFSISGILILSFLLLGVEIFEGVIPFDALNYINLGLGNTFWFKVALLLVLFLPLVGMLYGGIQILFEFKSPRMRPGLIIFLLWITSGVTFTVLTVNASRPYWNKAQESSSIRIREDIDTLYLKYESPGRMPNSRVFFDADRSEAVLFWMDGERSNRKIVTFPKVNLVRQSEEDSSVIYLDAHSMAYTYAEALIKAQRNIPVVELKDSLLTIRADIYDKTNKWDGTFKELSIYIPERIKVILQGPIRHDFYSDDSYNSHWCWQRDNDWD